MDYWEKAQHLFEHAQLSQWLATLPPQVLEELPTIAIGSDFAIRQIIQNTQGFESLVASGDLFETSGTKQWPSFSGFINKPLPELLEPELDSALRQYRNLNYIKIIWRDLVGRDDLWQTIASLSDLADELILACCEYHHNQLCQRYGEPVCPEGVGQKMVIMAMGKLGAKELNLSSDVDLIFGYPRAGDTQAREGQNSISNQEFFVKLGQKIIKSLSRPAVDGFVFRVDMRLRPFGQSGALALNFNALETYYQDHGRPWERYAMIKARPLCHNSAFGEEIVARLKPFVFRRYIDFGAIEELRQMKSLINQQVQRQKQESNIKIGPGGIREIEFVVQAFQLIRGGRLRELQQRSLLQVLRFLDSSGLFSKQGVQELLDAYVFLRRSEHHLQAVNDQQTHRLPESEESKARIARSLGFSSWESYREVLDQHRARVRNHFDEMVRVDSPEGEKHQTEIVEEVFIGLWVDADESVYDDPIFFHLSSHQVQACKQVLSDFRVNVAKSRLSSQGRERLDRLMPSLLRACLELQKDADIVLNRMLAIIESVLRRSVYIALLIEQPNALQRLVNLCLASPWLAEYLMKFPALIDELLYIPEYPYAPGQGDLEHGLREQLMRVDQGDLESHMEILRQFRNAHVFHAAVAEIQLQMPVDEVSRYLTDVAQVVLKAAFEVACAQVSHRQGQTEYELIEMARKNFAIVALGKMGSFELSYGSDLDLIFIYDKSGACKCSDLGELDIGTFFTRLTQRLIHILSTRTYSGRLYEIDTRLRPFGGDGLLVNTFESLESYLKQEAWTWEHQALVRARTVVGSEQLGKRFGQLRQELLCQPRPMAELSQDVCQMRSKMLEHFGSKTPDEFNLKHDSGGIVDIEFLTQFAVLGWADQYPELIQSTHVAGILKTLDSLGLVDKEVVLQLTEAYYQYRSRIHRLVLMNLKSVVSQTEFQEQRQQVQSAWQQFVESKAE